VTRPNILVLQHLASETPGRLGVLLAGAGMELWAVELDEGDRIPDLVAFDGLIAMGGPMDVWEESAHPWLVDEKSAIRRWVRELRRPFLGVCLGHQLLATALGGVVGPMPAPEVGVVHVDVTPAGRLDPLLGTLTGPLPALQWHGAQVLQIPPDGVVLASNAACAVQAMRVGRSAWGLQFHVEADVAVVDQWAAVPQYHEALAATGDGDPRWLRREVMEQAPAVAAACAAIGWGFAQAVYGRHPSGPSADTAAPTTGTVPVAVPGGPG
jgi:GMP synthase-like glutamine amidotransferase